MIRSSATRLSQRIVIGGRNCLKNTELPVAAATKRQQRRLFSNNPLEADAGNMGTHVHHQLSKGLAILAPIYFLVPDNFSDGFLGKAFGVVLAGNVSSHSWIGLNQYVYPLLVITRMKRNGKMRREITV